MEDRTSVNIQHRELTTKKNRNFPDLDSLHVCLEEKTVGDGGQAMVVYVFSPGFVFLHLSAGDAVTLYDL